MKKNSDAALTLPMKMRSFDKECSHLCSLPRPRLLVSITVRLWALQLASFKLSKLGENVAKSDAMGC